MDVHDLGEYAMQSLPPGVTLGEFKYLSVTTEFLMTRNDVVDTLTTGTSEGFGIRILKDGAWGFFATDVLTRDGIELAIKRATQLAEAARSLSPRVTLAEEPVHEAKVENPIQLDPFTVESDEKLEYFLDVYRSVKDIPEIKFVNNIYGAQRDHLIFYNSEGTRIEQTITSNGGYCTLIGRESGDTQVRKYPDDYFRTEGWEIFSRLELDAKIRPIAEELVQLLKAPQLKAGISDIILNPSQVGIQLHESCGHPSELDRALGHEAGYAGTSFLKTDLLSENFMYGNELVTILADATIPGALGTFYFDHEGVEAQRRILVEDGRFNDYLSSRETAPVIGHDRSSGSMRSAGFEHIPLVRMTNIVFQPQEDGMSLDEMIEETREGYYFHTNRSWSIDDIRLNFQFGCEVGYYIKDGSIEGLVKNPTYTGITPEFWNSVTAVGRPEEVEVLGTPFCGKGEPGQTMYTGHGGPPLKFSNIRVGVIN